MKYETFSKDVDQLTKRGVWPVMPTRVKVAKCLTKSNGINTRGFRESFVLGGVFFTLDCHISCIALFQEET